MKRNQILKYTQLSILTALVVILQLFGNSITLGGASLNMAIIPIVIGAVVIGPFAGAFLGAVCGFIVLFTPLGATLLPLEPLGTVIICFAKTALAGFCSGLVYKAFANKNLKIATLLACSVAPIINTAIFILGSFTLVLEPMKIFAGESGNSVVVYVLLVLCGVNFVSEFLFAVVLSPAVHFINRLLNKGIE